MENFSDSDDDDEYREKEDEKPTVVQLKDGDLTEEEAAKLAKGEMIVYFDMVIMVLRIKFQISEH